MHQQAGCILILLKGWLSTELTSKAMCLERMALSSYGAAYSKTKLYLIKVPQLIETVGLFTHKSWSEPSL